MSAELSLSRGTEATNTAAFFSLPIFFTPPSPSAAPAPLLVGAVRLPASLLLLLLLPPLLPLPLPLLLLLLLLSAAEADNVDALDAAAADDDDGDDFNDVTRTGLDSVLTRRCAGAFVPALVRRDRSTLPTPAAVDVDDGIDDGKLAAGPPPPLDPPSPPASCMPNSCC